jgi:hypothetical protein
MILVGNFDTEQVAVCCEIMLNIVLLHRSYYKRQNYRSRYTSIANERL